MIWTLTIIVTLKYVLFLLRADNNGEGGTLSLLALLMKNVATAMRTSPVFPRHRRCRAFHRRRDDHAGAVGSFGRRGSETGDAGAVAYVVPISVVILLLLFAVQSTWHGRRFEVLRADHG